MENKKQLVGSSSSFKADLFGSKELEPLDTSQGIFASICPPPLTAVGRNSSCSELLAYMQRQSSGIVFGELQVTAKKSAGASNSITSKERNFIFQERVGPCPLSSSLYYGGQEDMYMHSSSNQRSGSYPSFEKGTVEVDVYGNNSQGGSRGNWWEGSLYY